MRGCGELTIIAIVIIVLSSCLSLGDKGEILSRESIVAKIPQIDAFVEKEMKRTEVEKVSIAIVARGEPVYERGYGSSPEERFRAASITKAFLAYAALLLVEEGRLGLDEPLSRYAKKDYFPAGSESGRVTLRMVLTHTSGMGNGNNVYDWKTYAEPGKAFHYSTSAFIYLLNILDDMTGGEVKEYIDTNILLPLGMKASSFETLRYKGWLGLANGGLLTTPGDLAKFYGELMEPRTLNEAVDREMLTDSIRIDGHNSWGLGVGLQHGKGPDILWQTGNSQNLWHSFVYFSIRDRTGMVVMTKGKKGYKIYQDISRFGVGGSYYDIFSVLRTAITPK
jgi:CubicO group peptidase (beta-lactamase class C family)